MSFKFPYGNLQQLNLNWFIKKFQELVTEWNNKEQSIDGALQDEIDRAEDALSDVYTARDVTVAAKNDALQAKADALTAAGNAAQYWQNAANSAQSAAASAVNALNAANDTAADAAQTSSDRAGVAADKAAVAADKATVAADKATVAADKAAVAQDKDDVDTMKNAANAAALRSEGWAVGEQNGTPVASGSPYFENNAKYYKEQAEEIVDNAKIIKTIENVAIASFDDASAAPIQELVVDITPVQEGNGDPSPENVRPITGWTGCEVWVKDEYDTSLPATASVTFPDGQTVYGGTVDFTTGVLTVTYFLYTVTKDTALNAGPGYNKTNTTNRYATVNAAVSSGYTINVKAKSDILKYIFSNAIWLNDGQITFNTFTLNTKQLHMNFENATVGIVSGDDSSTRTAKIKTFLENNPITFAIPLNTPLTYQLTPQEISTLKGVNNVWANTGNINILKYLANSKKYIDERDAVIKAIIAKELETMTADTALTANDFRIVNDTLYRITANIAAGATLTPNTNCVATTVADMLKTLL